MEGIRDALMTHIAENREKFAAVDEKHRDLKKWVKQIQEEEDKEKQMADVNVVPNPGMDMAAMMAMANQNGLGGNGLLTGIILAGLLRGNNLFGAQGEVNPQAQANMSLMQAIGAVDKSVAVATQAAETSNALQSSTLQAQLSQVAQATVAQLTGVKEAVTANAMALSQQINGVEKSVMENRYELSKDISNDGEKTRALLVSQYEATLNRQLGDANARVIALESKLDTSAATRGVEVTTTNNINQMQQQQQQQQQWSQLYNVLWGLAQNIRSNNEAINVGTGTLTANPVNTNTNIR